MPERHREHLLDLIDRRDARVAVVGLGYVGLPLLDAVAQAGFPVIGIDHDAEKIARLGRGENYLPHLGAELPRRLMGNSRVELSPVSDDHRELWDADVILICVPTPLGSDNEPDLTAVERVVDDIAYARSEEHARPRLVVLESTTYPGTTREIVAPLDGSRDGAFAPFFVAFSPEREDPGNRSFSTRTIPKLVGGVDDASGEIAERFYSAVVDRVVRCRTAEIAEASKLVENVYRSVNIALANELKITLEAMGLDVWEVLDAAETKPFGFQRFDPGPGFGGHCVPIDPYYLAWRARQFGLDSRFVELAGEINRAMPGYVVDRCAAALGEESGRTLAGSRVLVLGIAYKRNVADVRESPAFEIIQMLRDRGADVAYHDPHVPKTWAGRRHDLKMESVEWGAGALAGADLVLVATDHDWYDWDMVAGHARLVVDTRNALSRATQPPAATVIKA